MGLVIVFVVYAVSAVLIAGRLLWRYKREPERRILFLSMFGLWLVIPLIIWLTPHGWIPSSRPGHPSWFNVAALLLLIGAITYETWRKPALWRRYVVVWVPIITVMVLSQIVYPLVWQR